MKKGDYIIIAITLLIAGVLYIPDMKSVVISDEDLFIQVQYAGELVREIKLTSDTEGIYKINLKNHYAEIEINNGNVQMLKMPKEICPKRICSETGKINRPGKLIVCLPNKLVVEIIGNKKVGGKNELDGISY